MILEKQRKAYWKAENKTWETKTCVAYSSRMTDQQIWNWLRKGDLKKTTEGVIMTAQDQAIRTRLIKH